MRQRFSWSALRLVLALAFVCAPAAGLCAPATTDPALTAADLETYFDGVMPYALHRGDVAGAEIVVVKDGQVLFSRGYGYADLTSQRPINPETTLFRPGSISKLFTWTAVMQLVEAGKLNLDTDVNQYLDFKIPPRFGKPVTLRDLMTHTAGFEEVFKNLVVPDARSLPGLEGFVKAWTPTRIYPPGQVVAYSNYGATLAGYIVQRVSGEPFEQYVARHIFAPLGMTHSIFLQQPDRQIDRATGYLAASGGPRPFEYVGDVPAGGLSSSSQDMARFMLANQGQGSWNGARILRPETVNLMLTPAFEPAPRIHTMALGFYGEDRNGHRIVGHAGDLFTFHADLHLMPKDGVGFYIALNSLGKDIASTAIRDAAFQGFVDRYFPGAQTPVEATLPSAAADGRRIVGAYEMSRRAADTFGSLGTLLEQGVMTEGADGTLSFSRYLTLAGAPKRWREIAPSVWREVNGTSLMSAVMENGRPKLIATSDGPPVEVWMPAPPSRSSSWNAPLLFATFGVLALTSLLWGLVPLIRRRYGQSFALVGRRALIHRMSRLAALVDLIFLGGWLIVMLEIGANPTVLSSLDPWVRAIQAVGVVGVVLAVFAIWNLALVWRDRPARWWGRIANTLIVGACLATLWFAFSLHLLSISLHY